MFSGYLVTQKERGEQASIFMKKVAGGDICPPLLQETGVVGLAVGKEGKTWIFQPSEPSWESDAAGRGRLSCIQMGIQYGRPSTES